MKKLTAWMVRGSYELTSEDIEHEIVVGIIECATHYRDLDAHGQPVFDFLQQTPYYIVRHAACRVSSELRRRRTQARLTRSYDAPISVGPYGDEGVEMSTTLADPSATVESGAVEVGELASAVYARLRSDPELRHDPTIRQVWDLTLTGHDRTDIGALLGLRRQRVHEFIVRLRGIISEIEPSAAALA